MIIRTSASPIGSIQLRVHCTLHLDLVCTAVVKGFINNLL